MEQYRRRTLLDANALAQGLDELAERLKPRLESHETTVIPILGGAVIFAADLLRRLPPGLVVDFLRIQTYGSATSPIKEAKADWLPHIDNVRGRHVLLLDDILDTGRTMREARRLLIDEMEAASVMIVVLVDKPTRRAVPIHADDRVLLIEDDLFLVGYGLDLAGRYRNIPELLALEMSEDGELAETSQEAN